MSSDEIKQLRKAGKLEEALEAASANLSGEPDNIWNKRAISWVYYEYLKKYSNPEGISEFKSYLEKIQHLELPKEENMLFDNCAFQIGKLLFSIKKQQNYSPSTANEIFELVKNFGFTKPSEAYSFIYKAFHKDYANWNNYLEFANWWGLDNFQSEDYIPEEYEGKKNMSIVEQAYVAYSKSLLNLSASNNNEEIQGNINEFIKKLDVLIENHPEYTYPPFFKAKLLLATGSIEEVIPVFMPFARKKLNDHWVWTLLAECYPNDENIELSCLSRAMLCSTKDDYLVSVRQRLAELLIKRNNYKEASFEIVKLIQTRERNSWKIPEQVLNWTKQEWFVDDKNANNTEYYEQNIGIAEGLIFSDIPEKFVVVDFVNRDKKMLNFITEDKAIGYFKYERYLKKPNIGDVLRVRLKRDFKEGYINPYTVILSDEAPPADLIKKFSGVIRILEEQGIGFVEDVFIDPKTISQNPLVQGQKIEGKAIQSFNKKKDEWGWKCLTIQN